MKNQNLPFEITSQIRRYLKELVYFNNEFYAQEQGEFFPIETFADGEQPTYKSEECSLFFWKYLEENKAIEMRLSKEAKTIFYEDLNFGIMGPAVHNVKILDIKPIKELLSAASDDKRDTKLNFGKVEFDNSKAVVLIDEYICQLPPDKDEHFFCRAMFSHPAGEPVSWDICYEEMTGVEPDLMTNRRQMRPEQRKVYDTMLRINNRIQKGTSINKNLFIWKNQTIRRIK